MVRTLALLLVAVLVLGGMFFALRPDTSAEGPRERTVEVEIQGDTIKPAEIPVGEGDNVTLRIKAARRLNLHLHGYDIEKEVKPGETTTLSFKADKTGRFEIEAEGTGTKLGALVVEPRQGG